MSNIINIQVSAAVDLDEGYKFISVDPQGAVHLHKQAPNFDQLGNAKSFSHYSKERRYIGLDTAVRRLKEIHNLKPEFFAKTIFEFTNQYQPNAFNAYDLVSSQLTLEHAYES